MLARKFGLLKNAAAPQVQMRVVVERDFQVTFLLAIGMLGFRTMSEFFQGKDARDYRRG